MAAKDFGRTPARCPRCYEIAPCSRCLALDGEPSRLLNAVCWLALIAIFVATNILLWRL